LRQKAKEKNEVEGGAYCYHANTVQPFTTSFGRMNHQGQTMTMEVKRL